MNCAIKNAFKPLALEMISRPVFTNNQNNYNQNQRNQLGFGQPQTPSFDEMMSSLISIVSNKFDFGDPAGSHF